MKPSAKFTPFNENNFANPKLMPLPKLDLKWIEEVNNAITSEDPPEPPESTEDIQCINDLSVDSTVTAIKKGRRLDRLRRTGNLKWTQAGLDAAGVRLAISKAEKFLALATHEAGCEFAPPYRDRRKYGKRPGEQKIVDRITLLNADGYNLASIERELDAEGIVQRNGKPFAHQKVKDTIQNAERGKTFPPCKCRMFRKDWNMPRHYSSCWEVLQLKYQDFEAMNAAGGIHLDTTEMQVRHFPRIRAKPPSDSLPSAKKGEPKPQLAFLNSALHGDNLEIIPILPDNSVSVALFSPPYGEQRKQHYPGIEKGKLAEHLVARLRVLRLKMKDNGSVLIVMNPGFADGEVSEEVDQAVAAIRAEGWTRPGRLFWSKPDAPPTGSLERPTEKLEEIYWFSKTKKPYVDLAACGRETKRKGLTGKNRHGNIHGTKVPEVGIAKVGNVFVAYVGGVDKGIDHPAVFPPDLVRQLLLTFGARDGLVLDPYCGSGTTLLVAQALGYDFVGIDIVERYVAMSNRRLKTESKYAPGAALLEREEESGGRGPNR